MQPKPAHLSNHYALQFSDAAVAAAYPNRPPYPADVYSRLVDLLPPGNRTVLDIGCGTGDIARPLAPLVERVDAVDISAPMMAVGRSLPGGNHPNLRWIEGRAEDAPLSPPYGLITAGESLHWMAWDMLMPRLREMLAPGGVLAIIERANWVPFPWDATIQGLVSRYSTNREFKAFDLIAGLIERGLFTPAGCTVTDPAPIRQTPEEFIESFHSRNGFSRDRMDPAEAAAFDAALAAHLASFVENGHVTIPVVAQIRWGQPGR